MPSVLWNVNPLFYHTDVKLFQVLTVHHEFKGALFAPRDATLTIVPQLSDPIAVLLPDALQELRNGSGGAKFEAVRSIEDMSGFIVDLTAGEEEVEVERSPCGAHESQSLLFSGTDIAVTNENVAVYLIAEFRRQFLKRKGSRLGVFN